MRLRTQFQSQEAEGPAKILCKLTTKEEDFTICQIAKQQQLPNS